MKRGFQYSLVFSAIVFSGVTHANTLTLDARASYTLDGGTTVNFSDIKSTTGSPAPLPTPGFVDVLDFTQLSSGSLSGIHTYGDTSGIFGSRSSGGGQYDVTGQYTQKLVIENQTSTAQHYYYNFTISDGEISARNNTLTAGQFANAEYSLGISLNGISLFNSGGTVLTDNINFLLNSSGTNIFTSTSCLSNSFCSASWSGQSFLLDLGILAVGGTLELTYDLSTHAWGNTGGPSTVYTEIYPPEISTDPNTGQTVYSCDLYGGEVTGTYNPATGNCEYVATNYNSESSVARFGDPDSLTGQPIYPFDLLSSQAVGGTVPEPTPIALIGAGLLGAIVARRRKKSA